MKKVIFSKYSNDRNTNYAIRTDILKDENGNKYIYKSGTTAGGKEHIKHMYMMYTGLDEMFKNTKISPNKCKFDDETLELEYVEGVLLEEQLDIYLNNGDVEAFKKLLLEYLSELRKVATEEFEYSEKFYEIFGDKYEKTEKTVSFPISNIDIIFENILIKDEEWILLDYEWTIDLKVPFDYILYRTALYYETPVRKALLPDDFNLYEMLGLKQEMLGIYEDMESHFQDYILYNNTPLWKLYQEMGKDIHFVHEYVLHKNDKSYQMQILHDYGEGFVDVDNYIKTVKDSRGVVSLDIKVDDGIKLIRIDPAERCCIVNILEVTGKGNTDYDVNYGIFNGITYDNKFVCYDNSDPQIWIADFRENVEYIHVEYEIAYISENMAEIVKNMLHDKNELKVNLEIALEENNGLKNSLSWKITKPLRKVKEGLS